MRILLTVGNSLGDEEMKKAAISIAVTFGVAFFLFFPWKIEHYEDGGTVTYSSLTYKICVWNSLSGKRDISEIYYFPENFKNLTELNDMETLDEKEEAHVMAEDSDGYYALCRLIVATYGYVEEEDCFVSDSGPRLHNLIFDGDTEELPVIRWSEDFSLIIPHEVELGSITVLNEKGEKMLGLDSESADGKYFSELPAGTYYVAVEIDRKGDYIETRDEYTYSVEQYAFCLEK